jgi:hypothetical protein
VEALDLAVVPGVSGRVWRWLIPCRTVTPVFTVAPGSVDILGDAAGAGVLAEAALEALQVKAQLAGVGRREASSWSVARFETRLHEASARVVD